MFPRKVFLIFFMVCLIITTENSVASNQLRPIVKNIFAASALVFEGLERLNKYLKKRLIGDDGTIFLKRLKIGKWDRVVRWLNNYKSLKMIVSTEVQEQLIDIKNSAQQTKRDIEAGLKRSYRNCLVCGPHGVGIDMLAGCLADWLDMDLYTINAVTFLQPIIGEQCLITFLNEVLKSSYGAILVLEDAHLLTDKNALNMHTKNGFRYYLLLNFLTDLIENKARNFILIAITDRPEYIDEDFARHFQDRVYIPLPDKETRAKLVNMYIKTLLFSVDNNGQLFVQNAQKVITPALINDIVNETEGLSGAEIKDIIVQAQNLALQTKDKQIDLGHVQKALARVWQKKSEQDDDHEKRRQKWATVKIDS